MQIVLLKSFKLAMLDRKNPKTKERNSKTNKEQINQN